MSVMHLSTLGIWLMIVIHYRQVISFIRWLNQSGLILIVCVYRNCKEFASGYLKPLFTYTYFVLYAVVSNTKCQ